MLQQIETKDVKAREKKNVALLILIFYTSSSTSSSTESENEIVDERSKIVPKGEEFKQNLPSSMKDYANLHFKKCIPKTDNEKILMENPFSSNLQEVPVLDDFMKTLSVSQTVITTDHQIEKFQENFFASYGSVITTLERIGRCSKRIF